METFKSFYTKMIMEGGNAISVSSRINQENVEATLNEVYSTLLPKLKLSKNEVGLLGSTGKKLPGGSSGDIDIAVSIAAILKANSLQTFDEMLDFIETQSKKVVSEVKVMKGLGVISLAWPIVNIDGKQEGQFVQLDLMLSDNVNWSKWAFYSPAEWESKWKGLYRNLLIINVAKYMNLKVLKTAINKAGEEVPVELERNFLDLNKGLMQGMQSFLGKAGDIVKTVKTMNKFIISQDPDEVVGMLFGPGFSSSQMLTWDDAFNAVTDPKFIYRNEISNILSGTAAGILNAGYPIPDELQEYVK